MSDTNREFDNAPLTEEEKQTALFAQMVMQSSSMAMVLMGRAPNPVTGKTEKDPDAARLFIEQLEMLEVKTKGNLTSEEQHLLKQNLMTVRMAYVQAVDEAAKQPQVEETSTPAPAPETNAPETEPEDGSKKKFSKSYGKG
jgi:hypothetical protein